MSARAKRQLALMAELEALAKHIESLWMLKGIFPAADAYTEGQCNSCLIVAYQQLETVVSIIRDCGEPGVEDAHLANLVLQIVERRSESRGARRLETKAAAANGVVRTGKRAVARVVAGGAR